jgi:surface protein
MSNPTILIYNFSNYTLNNFFDITLPITSLSNDLNITDGLIVTWYNNGIPITLEHPPDSTNPLTYRYTFLPTSLTVNISGPNVKGLTNLGNTSAPYLVSCTNIGTGITSLSNAFEGCSTLLDIPSTIPNNITNMSSMFSGCTNFNQPLNNWNIINVTHMDDMFQNCIIEEPLEFYAWPCQLNPQLFLQR